MKVVNIIEEGRFGGPHKRIIDIAINMRNEFGINTVVLFSQEGSQAFVDKMTKEELEFASVELTRPSRNILMLLKYVITFIPELLALSRKIKKIEPDVVYNNGSHQIKSILAARFSGVRVIWHLNDAKTPWLVRSLFRNVFGKMAHSIVASSRRTRDYYLDGLGWVEKKFVSIIPSPVDSVRFAPSPQTDDGAIAKKVIMIANLNPVKGIETFLKVADFVNNRIGHEVIFEVVGLWLDSQKEYSKKLLRIKEERDLDFVHFLGGKEDVKPYLEAADIYLCTSISESSPIAVVEAMCMELPIVATDVGDLKEVIKSAECGKVTKVGDVEALGNHVLEYLSQPKLAISAGKKGRDFAEINYSLAVILEKHYKQYTYEKN